MIADDEQTFSFASFAASTTNYLLPWLTLCAQLPYETGNPWHNFMSFCLPLGSPTLITYSLCITILNRFWVRKNFDDLRRELQGLSERHVFLYESRIRAVQFFLQEGQQVPLRASQDKIWLSSLIVLPENAKWWKSLWDRLKSTKRRVTYSLLAQTLFAAVAFLFIVIASFVTDLGDPTTALQIASGILWLWLVSCLVSPAPVS